LSVKKIVDINVRKPYHSDILYLILIIVTIMQIPVDHSITQAFSARVKQHPLRVLVKQTSGNKTFEEIDQASDCLAAGMIQQGMEKGDRIALYCFNGAEFIVSYLAILKVGGIVIPVNLLQKPTEISFILADAQVKGLIYHAVFSQQVLAFDEQVRIDKKIVIGNADLDGLSYESLMQNKVDFNDVDGESKDLAAILYTSGTTGFPKGAMLSHSNLLANTFSVKQAMCLNEDDCLLVVLPMFHSFASTVGMLTPLLYGMSIAPVSKFDPKLVGDTIEQCQATVFLGVPSMYTLLLRQDRSYVTQWKSIRFAISGGAAMPASVMQSFEEKFNVIIYEGDGPTECSPVTCVNPIGGLKKINSVGLAVPDVSFKICDEDGREQKQGEIGEICVSGPNVMQGYWNLPKETNEVFFDSWLRTGDLGYLDEDHYLFMVDRLKDMIIVNGMNVYPRIIEDMLLTHASVIEVAVVGEPNALHGEVVIAHVVLEDASIRAVELRKFCRENLGQHEVPKKIIIRESLPKNATGKIMKRELRKEGEIERGIDTSKESS